VVASGNFSLLGETSLLNGFVWSVAAPSSLFSFRDFSFLVLKNQIWRDSIHYLTAMSWLRMSILLFCHFFHVRLRLLLVLMKVSLDSQVEYGYLGHAAGDCQRAWFRDGSDGASPLLRILSRVGYVENAWNNQSVARPEKPANLPRWCGRRHNGTAGAISTKQYACLHWTVNEAIYLC
jgi:hypothetical protein